MNFVVLQIFGFVDVEIGSRRLDIVVVGEHKFLMTGRLRAALHLEAVPIPLEADCMKFQPFFGLEAGLNYTL